MHPVNWLKPVAKVLHLSAAAAGLLRCLRLGQDHEGGQHATWCTLSLIGGKIIYPGGKIAISVPVCATQREAESCTHWLDSLRVIKTGQ